MKKLCEGMNVMEFIIGSSNFVTQIQDYEKCKTFSGVTVLTKSPKWSIGINNIRYHDWVSNNALFVIVGDLFGKFKANYKSLEDIYDNSGAEGIFEVDGDFVFIKISSQNNIDVIQSNYGGPNLYYRIIQDKYLIASDASFLFFDDFSLKKLDERSVCDYLLYGSMIGGNTFHKEIKALVRGQSLIIRDGLAITNNIRIINFDSVYDDIEDKKIISELTEKYASAIEKRSKGKIDNSAMFLSGGKDSRLLLSAFTNLYEEKIHCISFGQFGCDETRNAQITASVNRNPFTLINLEPNDYIKNAIEYEKHSIGMDWFPQSYIISVLNCMPEVSCLYTGSNLSDICFHSKYMDENIGNFVGNFSEYISLHHDKARMTGFSREKLQWLCKNSNDGFSLIDHLEEDSTKYFGKPEDIYIGYLNNTNGANQISFRTNVFSGKYAEVFDPSQDKDYIKTITHLPLRLRLSDKIHVSMIEHFCPELLMPVYNDYKIPMWASKHDIQKAAENERRREDLYVSMMRRYNPIHTQKIYYPHDYADFSGFIKYDETWISYMDKLLANKDGMIYYSLFSYEKVNQMLYEHRTDIKNWKKELILLASLEQFLQIFIR